MEYAVFRFERYDTPEQWIVPTSALVEYRSLTNRNITIPVSRSEHGGIYNVLFRRTGSKISTAHGFSASNSYLFFAPPVTQDSVALDRLVDLWRVLQFAQKVMPAPEVSECLYRL